METQLGMNHLNPPRKFAIEIFIQSKKTAHITLQFLSSRGRPGLGPGGRGAGRDRREDQEARQDPVLPEEVAAHHMGHLHGRTRVRGQQQQQQPQRRWRRLVDTGSARPAQVQLGRLLAGRRA